MSITSTSYTKPKVGFVEAASGTGLAVTSNSNMTPSIAAGNYWLGGKRIVYAGGTTTIPTANPTLGRIDIVFIDSSGTVASKQGTPAASPTAPLIRDDVLPLARLTVTANDTNIATADIFDLRDFGGLSADGTTIAISSGGVLSVNQSGLNQFPSVVAAGASTTSITGNGAAQTVFSDTFTALAAGEICEVIIKFSWARTLGAGTPNVVTKLGATTIHTDAAMADGTIYILRGNYAPTFGLLEQNSSVTPTGTAAQNIVHNAGIATINQISVESTQAAGTNGNFAYSYHVIKYGTGV